LLWNPVEISGYDVGFFDGDRRAAATGATVMSCTYDPPPPVDGFWSVTMYSADNQLFVPNKIDRYSFGDRTQGHRVRRGRLDPDLPAARGAHRSQGAGELAPGAQGPLLPRDAPLLAAEPRS
jgi:hypothetical protein